LGENAQQVHILNFLLFFILCYLFFYSSYILHNRLQMTRETTLSTTSSIAPEEAQLATILGTTPEEEARLAVILSTTKCRCFYVFTLHL
jgi:hypothetical protein